MHLTGSRPQWPGADRAKWQDARLRGADFRYSDEIIRQLACEAATLRSEQLAVHFACRNADLMPLLLPRN